MFWILSLALLPAMVFAQEDAETEDRTLAPYFFVKSERDEAVDQLPLKEVSATVNIAGVIADVTIEQTYQNTGQVPIEAIYVFPGSTRAAVYSMVMRVGDRRITARIREREQARQEYEEAKEEGKSASLLEQHRPNVFQMNVANILPGDTVAVELRYTELLVPTEGVYEFVYPTVVGPRYQAASAPEEGVAGKWAQVPYQHEGEPPTYVFGLQADLSTGLPIQELTCTSHQVLVEKQSETNATVRLSPDDPYGGNRDFILRYRLAGQTVDAGLLLYRGEEENFFLLMAQPPARVSPDQIPPREYIFIVDVSGSMSGFPLEISKSLLRDLIGHLRPTDYFNVLLFAGGSAALADSSLPATEENVSRAIEVIDGQQGGGSTALLPALRRALNLPRARTGLSRTVVIATDGYVSVEPQAFDLIRERLGQANMFAFGIGSSVNRLLIEGIARAGMGEPFVLTQPEEAPGQAERFRQYIENPVLTQVSFETAGFEVYEVEPPSIPDVLAERPVTVFGKWRGEAQGQIRVKGTTGAGVPYQDEIDISRVEPLAGHAALRYLWARHRIGLLGDYNSLAPDDQRTKEITQLGLRYNLLTAYTSFVAIDQVVRRDGTLADTTIAQPLPLPQGVEDEAVGYGSGTAVEEELATAIWLGKEFYLRDEVWIDRDFVPGMALETYKGKGLPEVLARFAALNQPMIVVVAGKAYELHQGARPAGFVLQQNAPNPFNAGTTIHFSVPPEDAGEPVRLVIYNLAGQVVRVLVSEAVQMGDQAVVWDGLDERGAAVGSGVYIYRLEGERFTLSRRMVLVQ